MSCTRQAWRPIGPKCHELYILGSLQPAITSSPSGIWCLFWNSNPSNPNTYPPLTHTPQHHQYPPHCSMQLCSLQWRGAESWTVIWGDFTSEMAAQQYYWQARSSCRNWGCTLWNCGLWCKWSKSYSAQIIFLLWMDEGLNVWDH